MAFTYLGTLDDRCKEFPWGYNLDMDFLNKTLVRSVLFGEKLLLNDGYLMNCEACREAVMDKTRSPLMRLIDIGFVRILSRTGDLGSTAQKMKDEGVGTFPELLDRADWKEFRGRLDRMTEDLTSEDLLCSWPAQDMGAGFIKTILTAEGRTPLEMHMRCVDDDLLKRVFESYRKEMKRDSRAARTRWEEVCRNAVMTSDADPAALHELMHLGNGAYHVNFAGCLSVAMDQPVLAETRLCRGLAGLYDIAEADDDSNEDQTPLPTALVLPNDLRTNVDLLEEVLDESSPIGKARRKYLDRLDEWRGAKGKVTERLSAAMDQYEERLSRHFYKDSDLRRWQFEATAATNVILLTLPEIVGSPVLKQIEVRILLSIIGSALPYIAIGMQMNRIPRRTFFKTQSSPLLASIPVSEEAIGKIYRKLPRLC